MCAEFCEMEYVVNINHEPVANLNLRRGGCKENPNNEQMGTWENSRNGWCPGSVQTSLFLDVTDFLRGHSTPENPAKITIDANLRSANGKAYVNDGYFEYGNPAWVYVALNVFVYRKAAADAIRAQPAAKSPAEIAIRTGASDPQTLISESFLKRRELRLKDVVMKNTSQNLHNFGAGPWFTYSANSSGLPGEEDGAIRLPAFDGAVIQWPGSRETANTIKDMKFPSEWSQVAVHLRLGAPPGGKIDIWDRVGSFGLLVDPSCTCPATATPQEITDLMEQRQRIETPV